MRNRNNGSSREQGRPWFVMVALVVGVWGAGAGAARAQDLSLAFGDDGPTSLKWGAREVLGNLPFAVERVVLERKTPDAEQWWGHDYQTGAVEATKTEVDPRQQRIKHHYPWGTASMTYAVSDGKLELTLKLNNTTDDRAIADLKVRLIDLAFYDPIPGLSDGVAGMTLDRPFWQTLEMAESKILATCETFEVPVQWGFGEDRGGLPHDPRDRRGTRHAMYVWGGVPDLGGTGPVQPLMGLPHVPAGQSLTLKFALRFAAKDRSDGSVLRPYLEGYRASQGERLNWTDRRPIGRLDLPSSPRYRTLMNPRGWFKSPGMDLRTEEGKAEFREKLFSLADKALQRLRAADAQGVVVWNLEGGHVPPARPMGDPRLLSQIAPEMDGLADEFFKKFSEAGLRTGVTIRPSQLFFNEFFQRWAQGTGAMAPDPDPFASDLSDAIPSDVPGERIYPLVERLSDKIAYAKQRWGCSIFYIHFNGAWYQPAPEWRRDWMLFSGRALERLRKIHPDVLLIPQYGHRHWRTGRSSEVIRQTRRRPNGVYAELRERDDLEDLYVPPPFERITLRDVEEYRLGGTPTPEWTVFDLMFVDMHNRFGERRMLAGPRHVVRHSYWAHAAPYVELQLEKLIREYVLTLEQHYEYTEEEARRIAERQIVFETTPDRVRDWMPDAFTTIDVTGAEIDRRRSQIETAAAWGDVLMWKVTESPDEVIRLQQAAESKKQRLASLGQRMGLIELEKDQPLVPLSLVWRLGESITPEQFVSPGTDTTHLRARVAYTHDRRRALLMLSWRGGTPSPAKLLPDLPGIDVAGPHKRVWRFPSGTRIGGVPFLVNPDPVAGLNVIVVEASESAPSTTPAGVMLGASFNDGVAPDLGGGPPESANHRDASLVDGSHGQGLKVDGDAAVGFGIVPDWFGGTLEFDVKADNVGGDPLRLFKLQHHLNAELMLTRQGGRVGLLLKTGEGDSEGSGASRPRQVFVPLAGQSAGWDRVAVAWQIGQFRIYVNGKLAGSALGRSELKRRDGTILEPGILVGGGRADGSTAVVDSVVVYDWPFEQEQAKARSRAGAMQPARRPDKRLTDVWLWGDVPEEVSVGINARDVPGWHKAEKFRITLYKAEDSGRRQMATAEIGVYGGVAIGDLKFEKAEHVDFEGAGAGEAALDEGPNLGGSDLAVLEKELGLEQRYQLEVQPLPEGQGPPARSINFSAGNAKDQTYDW